MSETLADILPAEETAQAIRAAMTKLDLRRDAAIERRDTAECDRLEALRTPSMALRVVKHAETARHDALIDLDRVALLRNDLSARLKVAVEREHAEAQQAEIEAARLDHQAKINAFRDRLDDYERCAQVVADVCRLEDAMRQAGERFRRTVLAALPIGASPPADPFSGVDRPRLDLASQVVLPPARSGTGFIWKREPPPINPDAARYRTEAAIYGR